MNSIQSPLVSILIPVYNRENYIAECIESALAQTYPNIEVVVGDNASSDGTWIICQQFAAKDKRVRIFRNDQNIGPVRNWLACVAQARGDYSKILWSDDLIHPDFIKKLRPLLDDLTIGFVYSAVSVFQNSIGEIRAQLYTKLTTGIYHANVFMEGAMIGEGFPASPGCALFRTIDVRKNLLLDIPNRVDSDFSMHAIGNDLLLYLLTAAEYPKFAIINEPLAYFRAHQESITMSAPAGKIPLHYDLAKGFFAENFISDPALIKNFNTNLIIHLLKFYSNIYGIKSLRDFYPTREINRIDFRLLVKKIAVAAKRKLIG